MMRLWHRGDRLTRDSFKVKLLNRLRHSVLRAVPLSETAKPLAKSSLDLPFRRPVLLRAETGAVICADHESLADAAFLALSVIPVLSPCLSVRFDAPSPGSVPSILNFFRRHCRACWGDPR
jgi:hypothetical protein